MQAWLYLQNYASRESDSEEKLEMRRECPMRNANNGNCGPVGGFCTAVNDVICEAVHNAYGCGMAQSNANQQTAKQNIAIWSLADILNWYSGEEARTRIRQRAALDDREAEKCRVWLERN